MTTDTHLKVFRPIAATNTTLTCIYRNQKKVLETKVTPPGKVSGRRRRPSTESVLGRRLDRRNGQNASIASLSVAEGRITAVTFSASGR
ncbi:hypothetical protein GCM10007979_02920 [Nocardioides albus]|nr:hypothetical protein GCM10007979_02920 [Nocardioides albus]